MKRLPHIVLIKVDGLNLKLSAARLMTFSPASGLSEYLVTHEAAPRFRNALRAVNEALDFDRRLRDDFLYLGERAFTRENDA
jgi:hypothetical protein